MDQSFKALLLERCQAFIKKYPLDCENYDFVYGWRADDKYFALIRDFLNVTISFDTVREAIKLGNLGTQFVIKSKRAYSWLGDPINKAVIERDTYSEYHSQYLVNDLKAREEYGYLTKAEQTGETILEMLRR